MVRQRRIALALLASLATAGQAAAQESDDRLADIVATWVEAEATAFHGVIRDYIGRCLTAVAYGLPDEAKQLFIEVGDVPAARSILANDDPETLAAFQDGVRVCSRTATQFGGYVLDWVFATQLPDAEGDVLLEASFCIIDAFLPLDDAARQVMYLGIDQRGADLYEHGIPMLAALQPEVAEEMTAAVDACLMR